MARAAIAEFVGALLSGGIIGAAVAASVGYLLSRSGLGMGLLVVMLYAAFWGSCGGAILGSALVGRLLRQRGRLPMAAVWSILGSGLVLFAVLTFGLGARLLLGGGLLMQSLGAVLGYNLRRAADRQ